MLIAGPKETYDDNGTETEQTGRLDIDASGNLKLRAGKRVFDEDNVEICGQSGTLDMNSDGSIKLLAGPKAQQGKLEIDSSGSLELHAGNNSSNGKLEIDNDGHLLLHAGGSKEGANNSRGKLEIDSSGHLELIAGPTNDPNDQNGRLDIDSAGNLSLRAGPNGRPVYQKNGTTGEETYKESEAERDVNGNPTILRYDASYGELHIESDGKTMLDAGDELLIRSAVSDETKATSSIRMYGDGDFILDAAEGNDDGALPASRMRFTKDGDFKLSTGVIGIDEWDNVTDSNGFIHFDTVGNFTLQTSSEKNEDGTETVSYTHLTLPTKRIV